MPNLPSRIIPDADTPLWKLGEELAGLGGVRGQTYEPVPASPRYGMAVTDELYRKWQESRGVDPDKVLDDSAAQAEDVTEVGQPDAGEARADSATEDAQAEPGGDDTGDTGDAETGDDAAADQGSEDTPKGNTKDSRRSGRRQGK